MKSRILICYAKTDTHVYILVFWRLVTIGYKLRWVRFRFRFRFRVRVRVRARVRVRVRVICSYTN